MVMKLDLLFGAFGDAGIIINGNKTSWIRSIKRWHWNSYIIHWSNHKNTSSNKINWNQKPFGKIYLLQEFHLSFQWNCQTHCSSLHSCRKIKSQEGQSDEEDDESCRAIETKITSAPILAHPVWKSQEPFWVKTDFTGKPLGAKITHYQKESLRILQERVIFYDSRRFIEIESRYRSNKGELLAFIWTCQKHRFLLYPRKFKLVTYIALKTIKAMAFPRSLSLRWLEIIVNNNSTVEYTKAALHKDVDFLSRDVSDAKEGPDSERTPDDDDIDHESNALIIHQISWKNNQGQDKTTEECFNAALEEDEIIREK